MAEVVSVQEFFQEKKKQFKLKLIAGSKGLSFKKIKVPDLNRPAFAFAGFFEYFPEERLQVIGRTELTFLKTLPQERYKKIIKKLFSYDLSCIVVTQGLRIPSFISEMSNLKNVPIFSSKLATTKFISEAIVYFEDKLSPLLSIFGSLLDVYGIGVLLLGPSGIGKSEAALDLIERGHRLVADDVIEIKKTAEGTLVGTGREPIQYHMEIRGLGIIDIKQLFGISAIRDRKEIDLVAKLEVWDQKEHYDRLGLDEKWHVVLGVKVPLVVIPVKPGRHVAVIIEVAAMNERLKQLGIFPARELSKEMDELLKKK